MTSKKKNKKKENIGKNSSINTVVYSVVKDKIVLYTEKALN